MTYVVEILSKDRRRWGVAGRLPTNRRAHMLKNYLVKRGVPTHRVRIRQA